MAVHSFYCFLSFNASAQTYPSPLCDPLDAGFVDTDGDGVGDVCDLDDDNDGITDTREGCASLVTVENGGTFGISTFASSPSTAAFWRDLENPPGGGYSWGNGTNQLDPAGKYSVVNKNGGTLSHSSRGLWAFGGHTDGSGIDNFLAVNGSTASGTFFYQNVTLSAGQLYSYLFWHSSAWNAPVGSGYQLRIEVRTVVGDALVAFAETPADGRTVGWKPLNLSFNATVAGDYKILLKNISLQNGGNDFAIDDISFTGQDCQLDTDGDGIVDSQDLDSDNDGCPDTREAGHTDPDGDGRLGTSAGLQVDANGMVINQGGYAGTNNNVVVAASSISIDTDPTDQSVASGGTATFTVGASAAHTTTYDVTHNPDYTLPTPATDISATLTYQWQEETAPDVYTNITNGGIYSGATTATLTLTGVSLEQTERRYRVIVTHPENVCAVEQSEALLTVTGCTIDIGGKIYIDDDGISNGITGTLANGPTLGLYVTLRDGSGLTQVDVTPVDASGNYRFTNKAVGTYKLVLGTTSTGASTRELPADYFTIGEGGEVNSGTSQGDGINDGVTLVAVDCEDIIYTPARLAADFSYLNINFGISTQDPLPVKLISFDAARSENSAYLSWSTSSETNSDRFEIQRSSNGKEWFPIDYLAAKTQSMIVQSYSYTDNHPMPGSNLYRLKMIDRDNSFSYSHIQSVNFDTKFETGIYPNPVDDKLQLKATDWKTIRNISILNSHGREIYKSGFVNSRSIDVKHFSAGIYIVKITLVDGSVISHKMIKSK